MLHKYVQNLCTSLNRPLTIYVNRILRKSQILYNGQSNNGPSPIGVKLVVILSVLNFRYELLH